jgi:cytochrome c peroxidase
MQHEITQRAGHLIMGTGALVLALGCAASDAGLFGDGTEHGEELASLELATHSHDCEPAPPPGFSESEWQALGRLSPLPDVPEDSTNAYADSKKARTLGQKLFCDPGFSGPLQIDSDLGLAGEVGKVSCASCHLGPSLDDRRSPGPTSTGANVHPRNAPGIVNSSFYTWTNWGGRFSAQWELPMPVTEAPIIMNSGRLQVAHRIFDAYRGEYERVFGALEPAIGTDPVRFPAAGKPKAAGAADGPWESMTAADRDVVNRVFVNYGKAMAAYFRVLVSDDAAFDAFMSGQQHALGVRARRGARLFVSKARCVSCHGGPHFSDNEFHNLGLSEPVDDGRFKDVPPLLASALNAAGPYSDDPEAGADRLAGLASPMPESTRATFRTAALRGVEFTAPYMHAGQLATLDDVVDFYDAGGGTPAPGTSKDPILAPLGLSTSEKADLVAFLRSLSGQPIPARLLCDGAD